MVYTVGSLINKTKFYQNYTKIRKFVLLRGTFMPFNVSFFITNIWLVFDVIIIIYYNIPIYYFMFKNS